MTDVKKRVVDALADKLGSTLIHPGDPARDQPPLAIPMPFRTIHPALAGEMNRQAGLAPEQSLARIMAEAIIHTIESDGAAAVVDSGELAQLEAASGQMGERVTVKCRKCGRPVWVLRVRGNTAEVDPVLANSATVCPHA